MTKIIEPNEALKIANILAMDIDLLAKIVQRSDMTKEEIVKQVLHTQKQKNELSDQSVRDMRWDAMNLLASIPRDMIRSERLGGGE